MIRILAALMICGTADAHSLFVEAKTENGRVHVEVFFEEDIPAQGARVEVKDMETGDVVAAGRTDEGGVWECPEPGPGQYRVVAESAGHRAFVILNGPPPERPSRGGVWVRAGLGLSAIAGLCTAAWWAGRRRRPAG